MKSILLILIFALTSCANNPEANALAFEAAKMALAEYQRQHPVHYEK